MTLGDILSTRDARCNSREEFVSCSTTAYAVGIAAALAVWQPESRSLALARLSQRECQTHPPTPVRRSSRLTAFLQALPCPSPPMNPFQPAADNRFFPATGDEKPRLGRQFSKNIETITPTSHSLAEPNLSTAYGIPLSPAHYRRLRRFQRLRRGQHRANRASVVRTNVVGSGTGEEMWVPKLPAHNR